MVDWRECDKTCQSLVVPPFAEAGGGAGGEGRGAAIFLPPTDSLCQPGKTPAGQSGASAGSGGLCQLDALEWIVSSRIHAGVFG